LQCGDILLDSMVLKNQDILRIITRAFEGLGDVRIQIGGGLRIFGLNKGGSVYYNIYLGDDDNSYDSKKGVTVIGRYFSDILRFPLSEYLTDFDELRIDILDNSAAQMKIVGKNTEIEESLLHVPTGLIQEPNVIGKIDFSSAATCKIFSPKDYKLVDAHYDALKDAIGSESLDIEVTHNGVRFKPSGRSEHKHLLRGNSYGIAKTLISLPDIKFTSIIADFSAIKSLYIHVIDSGTMRFRYEIKTGEDDQIRSAYIEYVVGKAIEPED
jgi:hypothetical protein